jgi:hypothetical protein
VVETYEKGGSTASIVEIATGKPVLRITPDEKRAVEYFTLSHDRSTIAAIAGSVHLSAWDALTGERLLKIWPSGTITCPALSPDGKLIVHSSPKGGSVPLYQVATGKLIRKLPRETTDGSDAELAFSPDGRVLVSTNHGEHSADLWNVASGQHLATLAAPPGSEEAFFSPDSELMVLVGEKITRTHRLADRSEVPLLRPDDTGLLRVAFSPDFRLVVLISQKGGLKIREIASGTEVLRIVQPLYVVAFSPDSTAIAACAKNEVLIWKLAPDGLIDLAENERMELWKQLGSREASAAYPAVSKLAQGGPATADFLRRRLLDRPLDGPRLKALATALTGADAAVREQAAEEAADAAHDPALWAALETHPAAGKKIAEAQRAFVLQPAALLRRQRAVWALERMGAQDPLAEVAQGDARARQTIDARAALQRLKPH